MRTVLLLVALVMLAGGCAVTQGRERCGALLDAAWQELDLAKAEGFAGTVSHGKAAALFAHAKGQQTLERYPSCIEAAEKARFYIGESRKAR
jgi:hypothetical protein